MQGLFYGVECHDGLVGAEHAIDTLFCNTWIADEEVTAMVMVEFGYDIAQWLILKDRLATFPSGCELGIDGLDCTLMQPVSWYDWVYDCSVKPHVLSSFARVKYSTLFQ